MAVSLVGRSPNLHNHAMEVADRDRLVSAIGRALAPASEVQAALLFGSRATGRARPDSDIDVAVLLEPATAATEDPRSLLRRLLEALATELSADRTDLVILNDAPPALAFQVLKYGVPAFEREPLALHRFRVRTYGKHADYAPVESFFREVTRRRVLGGTRHGG